MYLRRLMRRSFAALWVRGADLPRDRGYVAVANHHSWWDGFIPYLLHRQGSASEQPFRIMMSDAELQRFPYFRFGGAFSVDPSTTRRAYASISYAAAQAHQGAAVWIFPDGTLRPPSATPAFTSGFVHAARLAGVPIVPVAMRLLFLDRQRPEVFVERGQPIDARARDARECAQQAVTAMLESIDDDLARDGRASFALAFAGHAGVDDRLALPRR